MKRYIYILTFSLLPAISFPAFATHKESVYKETKRAIVENLSGPGEYGFKRFLRDGYGTCFEGNGQRYYPEGKLKVMVIWTVLLFVLFCQLGKFTIFQATVCFLDRWP